MREPAEQMALADLRRERPAQQLSGKTFEFLKPAESNNVSAKEPEDRDQKREPRRGSGFD